MDTWEIAQARRIGEEVQRLRKASKRSAQWLSDKTDELGLKMTRQAITDLENGRRRYVTTAELIVLALALNTSPVVLVYPGPYDDSIELSPGREASQFEAAEWFSGEMPKFIARQLHPSAGQSEDAVKEREAAIEWTVATRMLVLWRELENLRERRMAVMSSPDAEQYSEQITFYDNRIRRLEQEILGSGNDA